MTLNEQLLEAVRCGFEGHIRDLVAQGAEVNYVNTKGWTALGLAVAAGQDELSHLLVELGARTDVRSPNGQDVAKALAVA